MKRLKETLTWPWARTIEASHFFMPFMVRRLQTHDAVCELEILEVVAEVKNPAASYGALKGNTLQV